MIISCAKSNLPILGGPDWIRHPFSRVVLLREGHPPTAGWYDGAGNLDGVDLRASGVMDEIRTGTSCLVIEDFHRDGDVSSKLGPSRIAGDEERRPGSEFIAACTRTGGFRTYEGYVLARDGKVTPEIGAVLTDDDMLAVRRVAEDLRRAIARRLANLAAGSSMPAREIEELLTPSVGLDVIPRDVRCRNLRLLGGSGLNEEGSLFEIRLGGSLPTPSPDDLAADLLTRFPPRKRASAILTDDGEPFGAIGFYETPELRTGVYISWKQNDVGMFGTVEQAIVGLGLSAEGAGELAKVLSPLEAGRDMTVALRRDVERRP